jgi:regulator of sirC expression with transglutaminase-like and TPR domain
MDGRVGRVTDPGRLCEARGRRTLGWMATPRHCSPLAYACFAEAVAGFPATAALVRAATAVAMHEMDDADPAQVEAGLDRLAGRIADRARSGSPRARLAHLHACLFDEEGFGEGEDAAHDPAASYLPAVLARRRGVPVTLCLVYKAVAERLDLDVRGLDTPGHFLASVACDGGRLIVDPSAKGRALTCAEAYERLEMATGARVPRTPAVLREADPDRWVGRLIADLEVIFTRQARARDLAAMREMKGLLLAER